jgi:large conductance mechanosensitive channel
MLREFRDFLTRGNLVELAVALVLAVAFAALVTSFDNLVMPIVTMIIGKPSFDDLTFTINDAVFRYGAFITSLITFLSIAAAVFFFVVRPVQALNERRRRGEEATEATPEDVRHAEVVAILERIAAK